MAGITLAEAEAHLAEAQAALTKSRKATSLSIDGQALTRDRVQALRDDVDYWDKKVKELSRNASGRGRAITVRPGW